jgi:hypothetical protein
MCCLPGSGHGHGHGHGHGYAGLGCCVGLGWGHHGTCCGGLLPGCCRGFGWRRFISPAEELERLKEYLAELKKEIAGVEARIQELQGK